MTRHRGARKTRELNQARSRTIVHYRKGRQDCSTETVLLLFPFLKTNITSQMWPSGSDVCARDLRQS